MAVSVFSQNFVLTQPVPGLARFHGGRE